jgi:hypothetical protein
MDDLDGFRTESLKVLVNNDKEALSRRAFMKAKDGRVL